MRWCTNRINHRQMLFVNCDSLWVFLRKCKIMKRFTFKSKESFIVVKSIRQSALVEAQPWVCAESLTYAVSPGYTSYRCCRAQTALISPWKEYRVEQCRPVTCALIIVRAGQWQSSGTPSKYAEAVVLCERMEMQVILARNF